MFKKAFFGLVVLSMAGIFLAGCRHPLPPLEAKLRVKVLIDGVDSLYIKGDKAWIVHHSYQLPGKFNGLDEPVFFNDKKWQPEWLGTKSDVFEGLSPVLPSKVTDVSLNVLRGRKRGVNFIQQPAEENDYTMIILFDDHGPTEAQWFVVDIDW